MAKSDKNVIKTITGDTQPFSWGQGKNTSGMSIRGARAAGVIKDVPAPKNWLDLAATLPNAPIESSPKSSKDKFAEKFNIAGQVAHINLETFYELMINVNHRRRIQNMGITTIQIEEPQLEGEFEFAHDLPDDWMGEPSVNMSVIYKDGLSRHIGLNSRMALSIGNHIVGIFHVDKISAGLSTHANDMNAVTSTMHQTLGKKRSYLTLEEFFLGTYSLSNAWTIADKTTGIEIINDRFEPHLIGKSLGTLYHAGKHPHLINDSMRMNIERLETNFYSHTHGITREAYLSRVFGPAATSIGILDTRMKHISAVLTPPDDFVSNYKLDK